MNNNRIIDYYNIDLTVTDVRFALSKRFPLDWKFKSVNRQPYGLIFITGGVVRYNFNGEIISAKENEIVFLKSGDSYECESAGGENLGMIHLSFYAEPAPALKSLPFGRIIRPSHTKRIKELFMQIEEIWYRKGIGYKLYSKSLIQTLIYELLWDRTISMFSSKPMSGLLAARDYVDNYYDRSIKVEALAEISGYSLSHFRKKFRETFGMSPIDYIMHVRVEKAKDMLRSQLYSKEEIAKLCGFGNVYYFNRVFKKMTQTTPGRY